MVAAAAWFPVPLRAQVAQIYIGTEFIYPTGFDPPTANGNVITPSIPRDFRTRVVGIRLTIHEVVVSTPDRTIWFNSLKQSKALTGNSDLMIAAAIGDADRTTQLLEAGTDANARNRYGSTALMGAAAGGHGEIVTALVARKADVNAAGPNGATPLMFAARNGHLGVVETLLKAGARPEAADNEKQTALAYAKLGQHEPIIKVLADAGAK